MPYWVRTEYVHQKKIRLAALHLLFHDHSCIPSSLPVYTMPESLIITGFNTRRSGGLAPSVLEVWESFYVTTLGTVRVFGVCMYLVTSHVPGYLLRITTFICTPYVHTYLPMYVHCPESVVRRRPGFVPHDKLPRGSEKGWSEPPERQREYENIERKNA